MPDPHALAGLPEPAKPGPLLIRTPDQRLRVFVSSTLQELAEERAAARQAITKLRLAPVMFELGARPHPPRDLYRAYLEQSHIFIGLYWQRYGWVAPGMDISGLEDEYRLSGDRPKLIYIKAPAPEREPRLQELLDRIKSDESVSYKSFFTPAELGELIENDLALLLTERFETMQVAKLPPSGISEPPLSNLPVPPTPLIGRKRELAVTSGLLVRGEVRLVTLCGAGGVGKTRLALEVAAELRDRFEDGVVFVSLGAIHDPDLVISAIAQALGVRETESHALLDSLKDSLRHKRLLLLLDNFEQVLAAAPLISDLLAAAPGLKVLVASRAALHLRAEYEFPIPPLEPPAPGQLPPLEQLSQVEAVRLFVERAQAVDPGFVLTNENASAVAEICQRLDGLPLAIELAAARIRLLPPQAMLARLSSSLKLLKGGARDLPARQQTLRDTMDWSYSLLNPDEQTLFARLGVFMRGCTLDAMESVCQTGDTLNVPETMASLMDKSLLLQVDGTGGEPRFVMLQTIREYAHEKLLESAEAAQIRQCHLKYFLKLAEQAEPELKGPEQMSWLNRLQAEHDNLRAALEWALASQDGVGRVEAGGSSLAESALRLAGALHWFWFVRGHWSEGRQWLTKALAVSTGSPAASRAKALNAEGFFAWYQGDVNAAYSLLTDSVAFCRDAGDKHNLAYALAYLALERSWRDSLTVARTLGEESANLFREVADKWGLAYTLASLGSFAYWQGDYTATRSFFEESIAFYREVGDKWRASGPLGGLGDLAYRHGDYAKAHSLYEESLALCREMGDKPGIAAGLNPLGDVARAQGDYPQAAAFYAERLALSLEMGDKLGITWARYSLGKVNWLQGNYEQARTLLEDSLGLIREVGDKGGIAWVLQNLGHLALHSHATPAEDTSDRHALENFSGVSARFQEALALAQGEGHMVTIAFCILGFAELASVSGQPERAARLWGAAEALCEASQAIMSAADRTEYEHDAGTVRTHLDLTGYAAAVAEGRALTLEQAIAYALEQVAHA